MSDKVWNLSSVCGGQIQSSVSTLQNLFVIALYLAGIYFAIAASRRHIKETLKSGEKVRIKFFWQHIASILLVAMPYLIDRISFGAVDLMDVDSFWPVLVVIAVIMLLTQAVPFVAGLLSGVTKEKKENRAKDESGDAKP